VATARPTTSQGGIAIPPDGTSPGYPTSPDGTPLPLVVIFDTQTVTIAGQVPSQAAKDRLGALAMANSQFPDVELVDNMVINPAVPISVGVRVIELNSARFPEGSAEILPDHARELDRVVTIMQALPNISVVVIGHADQRGDDLTNFAISDERARAVVNYLLYLGISPMRLSSRAAGESDLLTIGGDDAALALNRRTEFIFSGLLVE
jgi:outer membrane protein OmpA-like peptidoglycan-associated protein